MGKALAEPDLMQGVTRQQILCYRLNQGGSIEFILIQLHFKKEESDWLRGIHFILVYARLLRHNHYSSVRVL